MSRKNHGEEVLNRSTSEKKEEEETFTELGVGRNNIRKSLGLQRVTGDRRRRE